MASLVITVTVFIVCCFEKYLPTVNSGDDFDAARCLWS